MKQQESKKMQSLYEEWLGSGVSRASFARRHGITPNTFSYWIKKFQEAPIVKKANNFDQLSVEVPTLVNSGCPAAVIHFPSGLKIELYGKPEVTFLRDLVF